MGNVQKSSRKVVRNQDRVTGEPRRKEKSKVSLEPHTLRRDSGDTTDGS